MKKLLFVFILVCIMSFLQSCTKTCTCTDSNNKTTEIEINPEESCSDRSGGIYGECS